MPFLQHWFSYSIVEITALMYNSIKQKAMGYINSHCFSVACAILGKQATEQYTTCLHLYSSPYSRAICQYMGICAQWYLHSSWHQVYLLLYKFICILGPSFRKIYYTICCHFRCTCLHTAVGVTPRINSRLIDWSLVRSYIGTTFHYHIGKSIGAKPLSELMLIDFQSKNYEQNQYILIKIKSLLSTKMPLTLVSAQLRSYRLCVSVRRLWQFQKELN